MLPHRALGVAIGLGLRDELRLLLHRLAEPDHESLEIAQARGTDARARTRLELIRVALLIRLELLKLVLALRDIPFACGEGLRALLLDVGNNAFHRLHSFGSFHLFVSAGAGGGAFSGFNTSASEAMLACRLTSSWMSCARNFCMRGHSAMAASTRGSVPR